MEELEKLVTSPDFVSKTFTASGVDFNVVEADNFTYTDPVDNSVATKQVWLVLLYEEGNKKSVNNNVSRKNYNINLL